MSYLIGLGGWPEWVIRKIGEPIISEAEWNYQNYPNAKYGSVLDGTGTLSKDDGTNLFWGGVGSIKMLTDNVTGHQAKILTILQHIASLYPANKPFLLAFEQKWVQNFGFGNTQFLMGLEARDANIKQAGFSYTVTNLKWQYETAADVYSDFPADIGGVLNLNKPTISQTVGNIIAWCRCVIDPFNKTLIGFEAAGNNGKIETRDFRQSLTNPTPLLIDKGSAGSLTNCINPFVAVKTNTNNAEPAYTTDWCLSKILPGVDPFG